MKTITKYQRTIRDATRDVKIHVRVDDIKGAVCRDHQKCVVAKAIMRQRKHTAKWVDVGNSVVLLGTGKKTGLRYFLNGEARSQVRFFDENDGRFAPCSILLKAPVKRKLGDRKGEPPGKKQRSTTRQLPTR